MGLHIRGVSKTHPNHLLIDLKTDDNTQKIKVQS
jgi:hypothetical protein